jgi:iron complex outermembrane receptor protein
MARNDGPQRILKVGILCLFIVFGLCGFAEAENKTTAQQGNVFTLGQIEVSGETEEMANVTVDKITTDEMQEFSTDRLPDALNLLPGVTLSGTKFRNEQTVYIRGFGPSRVPVFLDGVPIYVPNDRTFDFNRFTTFDLSEIVVSKGFTSVLYGPNTMGGAINMVTRKPEKPFEGNAGVGYGTGNTYYGYANLGTNQKKWYLQGGVSYYNRDTYPMSNNYDPTTRQGGGNRIESYSRDNKVNLKIGLTPAKGHEYAFSYIKQHGDKGGPPDTRPNGETKFWLWPRWDKESLYLTTRTPLGEKSYAKVRLYYDKFVNTLATYTDNTYSEFNMKQGGKSYYNDWTVGGFRRAALLLFRETTSRRPFTIKGIPTTSATSSAKPP